jgi:hypothetical protein
VREERFILVNTPSLSPFTSKSPLIAASVLIALALAGCSSSGSGSAAGAGSGTSGGNVFSNLLFYGGTTVPPEAPQPVEEIDCPAVQITEGGAAIRLGGAESGSVRHQITISQVARECSQLPNGAYSLKVGVEGRALLGPAGSPGRFEAPVRIRVTRDNTVIADRVHRQAMTIPANDSQATFVHVEQGIVVQPGSGTVKIEVSLDAGRSAPTRQARQRR